MTTDTPTPARPRVRRGLLVALALSLAIAAHASWDYVERRRLVAVLDAIQARGEPVEPRHAERSDAGVYYLAAAMLTTRLPSDVWLLSSSREASSLATADGQVPERREAVRRVLESGRFALTLADEAGPLEFDGFPRGYEWSTQTAGLAALSRLVALRTHELADSGAGDAAAASAVVGLRARRSIPALLGLVPGDTSVGEVLSRAAPSAEALRVWQTALEETDDALRPVRLLLDARARFVDAVWRQTFGPSPARPRHQSLPTRGVLPRLWRPWLTRQIVADLREWDEVIEIARRSPAARAQEVRRFDERRRATAPSSPFQRGRWFMGYYASTAWPMLSHAVRYDTLAGDRAARVTLAIERYRRDYAGALPSTLDVLVSRYLSSTVLDPFTDAPLSYRRTEAGYVVYSVGSNLKDDGGDVELPERTRGANGLLYQPEAADLGVAVRTSPSPGGVASRLR